MMSSSRSACYDRVDSEQADVAFTVRDDQQGRGLGTLLLEHLAVVARANNIRRFRADTLIDNFPMLGVFTEAGWHTTQQFSDGAIRVEFDIAPTFESLSAVEARESRAEAVSVQRLLAPRSIAVIGVSRRHGTIGHEVFRNLLAFDFQGPVYPVNPASDSVGGVRAYASVVDVPDDVDLAVVVVPAAHVPAVVEECAAKRVHGLVVITAGFAEVGAEGKASQRQVLATVRRHGMRMIGPNCLGVVNTDPVGAHERDLRPTTPLRGPLFPSQSGGLGIELMARAGALDSALSHFVSVGNKAAASGNDLLQYWRTTPNTDVFLSYLESFGNPRSSRAAWRVPAGSSPSSWSRAAGHSPEAAWCVVAHRRVGVARCRGRRARSARRVSFASTRSKSCSTPWRLHPISRCPPGRRVATVSNAGGRPGILAADACARAWASRSANCRPMTQEGSPFLRRPMSGCATRSIWWRVRPRLITNACSVRCSTTTPSMQCSRSSSHRS